MRKLSISMIAFLMTITLGSVSLFGNNYDIQVYTADNKDGKITKDSIENAFKKAGFYIDGNNNMNAPFKKRFGSIHYKMYRLMFVHMPKQVALLAKDYPQIGLISPLSTSVYSTNDGTTMNISTLTLEGMSRISGVPASNKLLIEIAENLNKAVKSALPNAKFVKLSYKNRATKQLATTFETEIDLEDGASIDDAKESFQEELEGELEPVGFIIAGFINLNDEFIEYKVDGYDFYDVYSICKLEVIHPVSKTHPEVGAFAPCSFYMYKKKGEDTTHMGFPSVENWIQTTDMKDKESLKPLLDAQELFKTTVSDVAE
jgi:uncharacterized protein (DUF302 family)